MKKILFLCPHSAAKSVLATSYFNQSAAQRGLDYQADFAGTEPDEAISPKVIDLLQTQGFSQPLHGPRLVTEAELSQKPYVISMGCDLAEMKIPDLHIEYWTDVPAVSVDAPAAANCIYQHIEVLLDAIERSL